MRFDILFFGLEFWICAEKFGTISFILTFLILSDRLFDKWTNKCRLNLSKYLNNLVLSLNCLLKKLDFSINITYHLGLKHS